MTSLLTTANTYGWAGKNLRAGLGATRHPAGTNAPTSGNLSLSTFSGQYPSIQADSGVVTILAGAANAAPGFIDGTGAAARFNIPYGIAVDSTGNLYVADTGNNAIRKITSGGVVSTLAGAGQFNSGSADGTGAAARFNIPNGIDVDSTGNLFVTDMYNHTIRKITPTGLVSTFAGTAGSTGSADGTGAAARFNVPNGIVLDSTGNMYVTDNGSCIRKITSLGVVSTLAGVAGSTGSADGAGTTARFFDPKNIDIDSTGNLYVADARHTIRKITPTGIVSTFAGTAGSPGTEDGTGAAARFIFPYGIAVDSTGNVYVTENCRIRKITPGGVVSTLAGVAGSSVVTDGTGSAARFGTPLGIAVDSTGNLYVAEGKPPSNMVIRKIT